MLTLIKPQTQPDRYTITRHVIQQRRILAEDRNGAGFQIVIIHSDAVVTDNIEAHAMQ